MNPMPFMGPNNPTPVEKGPRFRLTRDDAGEIGWDFMWDETRVLARSAEFGTEDEARQSIHWIQHVVMNNNGDCPVIGL